MQSPGHRAREGAGGRQGDEVGQAWEGARIDKHVRGLPHSTGRARVSRNSGGTRKIINAIYLP